MSFLKPLSKQDDWVLGGWLQLKEDHVDHALLVWQKGRTECSVLRLRAEKSENGTAHARMSKYFGLIFTSSVARVMVVTS